MNKDLDERLVPNGEYRDAMNIQVRTTDSGDDDNGNAGTVQNIKGNKKIDSSIVFESSYISNISTPDETTIVGSIANEKNNKAYFFIAGPTLDQVRSNPQLVTSEKIFIDTIAEVDTGIGLVEPSCEPVVIDKWAIVNTATNVLSDPPPNNPNANFLSFSVADSSKYRIGMSVEAIDSNGEDLFAGEGKIQDIDEGNIILYTEINYIQPDFTTFLWSNVSCFIFEHPNRVLRFNPKTRINAINIIDDLLFWTDDKNEPKKINIERCKEGTTSYTSHTQLKLTNPKDSDLLDNYTNANSIGEVVSGNYLEESLSPTNNNDLKEEHITVIRKAPLMAPVLEMKVSDREGETTINDIEENFAILNNSTGPQPDDVVNIPTTATDIFFNDSNFRINDILRFEEQTVDAGLRSWFTAMVMNNPGEADGGVNDDGNVVLSIKIISISGDISIPLENVDGAGFWKCTLEKRDPLFELTMGRFGLRYKYEDGEYSSFGPWSELAFLPDAFDYSHKKGYNLGMVNTIRSLVIKDFIPHQRVRPFDVTAVDILWKTTTSPNVYVVKTITRGIDPEWTLFSTSSPAVQPAESQMFGKLNITSEMIHKTLPANQLLRAWDNVPRFALSQEIAANRVVYGNYVQGYDIKDPVSLTQSIISDSTATINNPTKSIKTKRQYKFGMVFGDKYGRETPVISSAQVAVNEDGEYLVVDGGISLEKRFAHMTNRFELTQNWSNADSNAEPLDWMRYVKYYVKETSSEYYNLVMDKWYEAEDGNIWISFNSADRN